MKTVLVLASMVSVAEADCHLNAAYKHLSASGTIPSVTTISDACCDDLQTQITKFFKNPDTSPQDSTFLSPQEKGQLMQDCQSFAMYMQQWQQDHANMPPGVIAASLPAGFKFKESVSGGGATACSLHASLGAASVSCDIPESTTISTECCDAVQGTIDQPPSPRTGQELQQDLMTKCQSVMMWGQQRLGKVGPPPQDGPGASLRYLSRALPAGMSCTEKTGSGMAGNMLNAILEIVEVSGRSDTQELEAQPASSSFLPTIFVAGTAGALGGLLAFFALSKVSSKPQRVPLISDDA
jgi:hypothetical protein